MSRSPSADEAAAIAAAIERFQADVAPATAEERPTTSPWQRAALLEGVGAKVPPEEQQEGGARWLS
jgi:hypothetical protein